MDKSLARCHHESTNLDYQDLLDEQEAQKVSRPLSLPPTTVVACAGDVVCVGVESHGEAGTTAIPNTFCRVCMRPAATRLIAGDCFELAVHSSLGQDVTRVRGSIARESARRTTGEGLVGS